MKRWNTENEARDEIKELVADFYHEFKEPKETKENFKPGNRVSYASRVYDEKEMQSLTDAMLDFNPDSFGRNRNAGKWTG